MDIDMGYKSWKDMQIDLEFHFPYYGFRFNYTFVSLTYLWIVLKNNANFKQRLCTKSDLFVHKPRFITQIYPEGFVAFDRPRFIQPPYIYPNPRWPEQPDPSFIAAFLMEQNFAHIGETRISHVWFRTISRPIHGQRKQQPQFGATDLLEEQMGRYRPGHTWGRVEDPELLDQMRKYNMAFTFICFCLKCLLKIAVIFTREW